MSLVLLPPFYKEGKDWRGQLGESNTDSGKSKFRLKFVLLKTNIFPTL